MRQNPDSNPIPIRGLTFTVLVAGSLGGCGIVDAIFTAPEGAYGSGVQEAIVEQTPIGSNRFVLLEGQDVVGEIQIVLSRDEDTFVDIGRAYGLGFDELVQANPEVDPWLPGAGTPVVLPTRFVLPEAPREGFVLNVASKRLFYYPPPVEGEARVVETYPIGIGRQGWATPTGDTAVVSKARDPVWFVPASIRREHAEAGDPLPAQVPPGPDNPLGEYVLGLGLPGYLIHGTNKPAGVGMRVSHGCIRLYPEDIDGLYPRVNIGTPVRIVNQPYLLGWVDGDLVLEAHPPLAEDERDWLGGLPERARASLVNYTGYPVSVDDHRMGNIANDQRGFPVSVLRDRPDTRATLRKARRVENIVTYDWMAGPTPD